MTTQNAAPTEVCDTCGENTGLEILVCNTCNDPKPETFTGPAGYHRTLCHSCKHIADAVYPLVKMPDIVALGRVELMMEAERTIALTQIVVQNLPGLYDSALAKVGMAA